MVDRAPGLRSLTMEIEANVDAYMGARDRDARFTSFDYCYNYFQNHRHNPTGLASAENLETSCLHLGFYLASWGMYRGSSTLLKRSLAYLRPVVEELSLLKPSTWEVDADSYASGSIGTVLDTADRIRRAFPAAVTDTLVTKILLGTLGSVPAFDSFFKRGFRVSGLSAASLAKVGDFYLGHAEVIERIRPLTVDFATGNSTALHYSRAKVIDMIFFIEGGYPAT